MRLEVFARGAFRIVFFLVGLLRVVLFRLGAFARLDVAFFRLEAFARLDVVFFRAPVFDLDVVLERFRDGVFELEVFRVEVFRRGLLELEVLRLRDGLFEVDRLRVLDRFGVGGRRSPASAAFSLTVSETSGAFSTTISSIWSAIVPTTFWAVSVASSFFPASVTDSVRLLLLGMVPPRSLGTRFLPLRDAIHSCGRRSPVAPRTAEHMHG